MYKNSHNVKKREKSKKKETPLVRCRSECADEPSDYRDNDHEYGEEEIRQGKAGRQQ